MKLLANTSFGYQIVDRSRHTVTKYLSNEKTHAVNNSKLFKKLDHVNNSLYEVEHAKAQIGHKEPILVRLSILQYAKLRMLEMYYNFFTKFCDVNKFKELERHKNSLYLALAEKELEDCIRPEMGAEWQRLRPNDSVDSFTADAVANFFLQICCEKLKQLDERQPGSSKKKSHVQRCYVCVVRRAVTMTSPLKKLKFSIQGLNKRVPEQSGNGPVEKYRRVLNEEVNVTSIKRGFRAKQSLCCYLWTS